MTTLRHQPSDYTALLLAGGQSRRMRRPKALLPWKGGTIASHLMAMAQPLVHQGLVVGTDALPMAAGWSALLDEQPGQGPVGGLAAALPRLRTPYALVLSCDVPLLTTAVLQALLAQHAAPSNACLVDTNGRVHPLVGVYTREAGACFQQALAQGQRRLMTVLETLPMQYLPCSAPHALTNINTPEQYQAAYVAHH